MTAIPVKAHQIASLGGARSADGNFGLIHFVREKPMTDGTKDLWVAVPKKLLPYLASVAVKQLPQPPATGASRNVPHALKAKQIAVGVSSKGSVILSVMIDQNAAMSYELNAAQAREVLNILQAALGDGLATAPAKAKAKPKPKKPNGK
jgi:hypothetical protein